MEVTSVSYSWTSDEPFLRNTIFIGLLGLSCFAGALVSLYFVFRAGFIVVMLLIPLLLISLACLLSFRNRTRDMGTGPSYVPGVVTDIQLRSFGKRLEITVSALSETRPETVKFSVARRDSAQVPYRGRFRFLRYPHSHADAAVERYDYEAQEFVAFRPTNSDGSSWTTGFFLALTLGESGGLFLLVPLLPLWLLAYLMARIAVATRRAAYPVRQD